MATSPHSPIPSHTIEFIRNLTEKAVEEETKRKEKQRRTKLEAKKIARVTFKRF
jgi:hypothetical protein